MILLPVLAVAFAAFCVWLMVRIVNRRERWAKWTLAAAIGLPALYLLGFGIVCRVTAIPLGGTVAIPPRILDIYSPIGVLAENRNTTAASAIRWYMQLWTPDQGCVMMPTGRGRFTAVFPYPPKPVKPPVTQMRITVVPN